MLEVFGKISKALNISGRDAKVFIVSLLLAYSIWLIHNLSLNYTETVRIPVRAVCDIEGHSAQSANSTMVLARCRTSGFSLIRLGRADRKPPVAVRFSSSDMHQMGGEMFYVTAEDLNRYVPQLFGNGTKLDVFVTDTAMFRFPFENHKRVPVQAVYSMSFKPQYTNAGPLKVTPDSVTVYGEPFHLSGIDKVFTESLSLYDLDSPVHGEARLDQIKNVRLSDETVLYSMDVTRYVEMQCKVPVFTRNVPKGRTLVSYPSVADVTLHCTFPVTNDPTEGIRLYIDYEDFEASLEGQCLPHLEGLPHGVIGYAVKPRVFDCVESGK